MVTLQMHVNGDSISHEKSDDGTIQTQYDWYIDIQQSCTQWSRDEYPAFNVEYFLSFSLILKKVQQFISR
jgi:hypothetical protein